MYLDIHLNRLKNQNSLLWPRCAKFTFALCIHRNGIEQLDLVLLSSKKKKKERNHDLKLFNSTFLAYVHWASLLDTFQHPGQIITLDPWCFKFCPSNCTKKTRYRCKKFCYLLETKTVLYVANEFFQDYKDILIYLINKFVANKLDRKKKIYFRREGDSSVHSRSVK